MKEGKQEPGKAKEKKEAKPGKGGAPERQAERSVCGELLSKEALEKLEKRAAERDEFLDLLKRARADLINYQKRVEREKEALRKFALQEFLAELLPTIDDLQRAIAAGRNHPDVAALLEGMEMLEAKLGKLLEQRGVEAIESVGRPFDPGYHEAVAQEETDEHSDLTVLEELQKGYMIHDRVLRPARVRVSRRREAQSKEAAAGSQKEEAAQEDKELGPVSQSEQEDEEEEN